MVKRATTDVLRNSDLNPHGCGGLRQKNRFLEDELSNPGDHITIADERTQKQVLQYVLHHLSASWADEVQRSVGAHQNPQQLQNTGFRPWRFVDMQLRRLLDVGHQRLLQRRAGPPRFPDRLINHARTQIQAEQLDQEFTYACS